MNIPNVLRNPKLKRIWIILGIALICGWAITFLGRKDNPTNPQALQEVGRDLASQSQDSLVADSPYKANESLKRMKRQAQDAEKEGRSSVELAQITEQPAVHARIPGANQARERREFTRLPTQIVEKKEPAPVEKPAPKERDAALETRVAQVLGAATTVQYGQPGAVQTAGYIAYLAKKNEEKKADLQNAEKNATEVKNQILPEIGLQSGEILYAIMNTASDSDQGSTPVMATVLLGKFKGAKCIGTFKRLDERLVLQFTKIQFNGKTYSFNGYAIDPKTQLPGIASKVDTHFFERWGGLVASSFLQGFGSAISNQGSTTQVNALGTTAWRPKLNTEEQVWAALGTVGEKAGQQIEKNFDRPPTVTLDAGTEIGILVL